MSLRVICSAVCLVRFMVESPAQSGRLRTLIHPGPVAGVHVILNGHGRLYNYVAESSGEGWTEQINMGETS